MMERGETTTFAKRLVAYAALSASALLGAGCATAPPRHESISATTQSTQPEVILDPEVQADISSMGIENDTLNDPTFSASSGTTSPEVTPPNQACIDQGLWELHSDNLYHQRNDQACSQYIDRLFSIISSSSLYAKLNTIQDQNKRVLTFQRRSGIATTGVADSQTVQTLAHEATRVQNPGLKVRCNESGESEPTWSREQLVDILSSTGGFLVKYDAGAPRTDLLDPAKSNDLLIKRLSALTYFAICHRLTFNVLMVNTGHAPITKSGNVSDHVKGMAVDIRPMIREGTTYHPMSPWDGDPTHQTPAQVIRNNPSPNQAALEYMNYFAQRVRQFSQIIWTDSPFVIDGASIINTPGTVYWHKEITDYHNDHVHIAVQN